MAIREVEFQSYNGRDTVKAWIYTPIRKPRGIVQLVHGLIEHSRCFLYVVLELNEAGFVVCADDHVGHGKTAADSDTWGDFGFKGCLTTTEDEKTLHDLTVRLFPDLPCIMYGHSWGSMIARNFAAHYGDLLKGLVISGTGGIMNTMKAVEEDLRALVTAGKGGERDPLFLGRMFADFTSRYENPATPHDWISADRDVVTDFLADPLNNNYKPPTNQSNLDIVDLVAAITGPQWAEKVPKDLPVYNIAGDQDPVGNYGEGVYAVSNWLSNTGHKRVTTRIYTGHRHEIHQDRDIRGELAAGIISFINGIL
jgi:alpha-beta hydrolase superfamily lysophospholipase